MDKVLFRTRVIFHKQNFGARVLCYLFEYYNENLYEYTSKCCLRHIVVKFWITKVENKLLIIFPTVVIREHNNTSKATLFSKKNQPKLLTKVSLTWGRRGVRKSA